MTVETPANRYRVNLARELSDPHARLVATLIVTAASKEDAVDKALAEVGRGSLASVLGDDSPTETHASDVTLLD